MRLWTSVFVLLASGKIGKCSGRQSPFFGTPIPLGGQAGQLCRLGACVAKRYIASMPVPRRLSAQAASFLDFCIRRAIMSDFERHKTFFSGDHLPGLEAAQ